MIVNFIFQFFLGFLQLIFTFWPTATVAGIPYIGPAISGFLYSIMYGWNAFMVTVPYAQIVWFVFLNIIIPFEIAMLLMKFVLGHRRPTND